MNETADPYFRLLLCSLTSRTVFTYGTFFWYHQVMTSLSAAQARAQLYPLLKKVTEDHEVIEIASRHGSAVLVDADDYRSLAETEYLLRSPANAKALRRSLGQIAQGHTVTVDLDA